jgi:hypothetical protein
MGKYDDIIHLPHHTSSRHPRMSTADRAAQFSPFAALTGYDAVISETGRRTDGRLELTEDKKAELDEALRHLLQELPGHPAVRLTCFVPDERKEGGAYVTVTGNACSLQVHERLLTMTDGTQVSLDDIVELEL